MKKLIASLLPDALMVAGAGALSYGAWAIYPPAGFLMAGVLLLVAGLRIAKVN